MSWYPVALLVVVTSVWGATFVTSLKVLREFVKRYPQEAASRIPEVSSFSGHPEKLLFVFREWSQELFRADLRLWQMRKKLKVMLVLSCVVPIVCMVVTFALAWAKV